MCTGLDLKTLALVVEPGREAFVALLRKNGEEPKTYVPIFIANQTAGPYFLDKILEGDVIVKVLPRKKKWKCKLIWLKKHPVKQVKEL